MKVSKVAVLRGGPSAEYEVSMQTGAGVLSALQDLGIQTKDIVITRSGQWLIDGFSKAPENALHGTDVIFLALHGTYGEDGTVQRLLDRLSIPYTGSGPYASAVAMNKELAKSYLKDSGIKTAQHIRVTREGVKDSMQTALSISEIFGPIYIVKPTKGSSARGAVMAKNPHELGAALTELFTEYEDLLVEEYIVGKEATIGLLENFREQDLYHLPVVQVIPTHADEFFSAAARTNGETEEVCPGRFMKEEKDELAKAAKTVHKILGLRHYSRSDFIVADDGIYFLEANTLPSLIPSSLYLRGMESVGGTLQDVVGSLINQAADK